MVPELRERFNSAFTAERYAGFVADLQDSLDRSLDFRICETPFFLSDSLGERIVRAGNEIAQQVTSPSFEERLKAAVPSNLRVARETEHSTFLQIDFALAQSPDGRCLPQLIELQGFPSLFGFQHYLNKTIRRHFDIPAHLVSYFGGLDSESYPELLRQVIVGDCHPENVILLEVKPAQQRTRADFLCTQQLLGIPTVCVTDLRCEGSRLYYSGNRGLVPVQRIYNRLIFEDALRHDADCAFLFNQDLQVEWVGHPNWFFKISKFVLPLLNSVYCPASYFLGDLTEYPADLEQYVLKPLYSFAGGGVEVSPTPARLDAIENRGDFILQRRVEYLPLIQTPVGVDKVEIRLMFLWLGRPVLVNNLVRTSRGSLMGVAQNRDQTWVGASIAYHSKDIK